MNRIIIGFSSSVVLIFSMLSECFEGDKGYAPSIILVYSPHDTNMTMANNTIEKHNCTIMHIYPPTGSDVYRWDSENYTFKISVPVGYEKDYVQIFKDEPLVATATVFPAV